MLADYEMTGRFGDEDAQQSIEEAEAFLRDLAAADPRQIGETVEKYILKTCKPKGGA
jgi:hypothetical protein